ncbi:MAG: HAD family hydrolase [Chloroflexota bacterium]
MVRQNTRPIRLLVFDIDGVLTNGEVEALDLALLSQLAELNRLAQKDATYPAVTVCTGRPAPYAEAILQAIDGHVPGVFENGAGLYISESYQFLPHPTLGDGTTMQAIQDRLLTTIVKAGQAYFQPGKEFTLTLFAQNPAETNKLAIWVADTLGELSKTVDLVYSVSCLNIIPKGIDKGAGVAFLAAQTGYSFDEMLGVGDSDVDPPFLALVGHSAAPSNANNAIKQMVDYVAPRPSSEGVRDILSHFNIVAD